MQSHRARELMAEGKFSEAVPIYRQLVRALPRNPGLLTNLGMALDMSGSKQEAVRAYQAALKLDPGQYPALLFLGTAYLDLGDPAKALEPLERALKIEPASFDAQEAVAEALLGVGRLADADHRFQELARAAPDNPKVWYGLGLANDGLAQRSFDELAKLAPGSAYWLRLVADSRLERKQDYAAFYFYRHALAKMPAMRGVRSAIAEIYRRNGHADWAAVEESKEKALPAPDCAVKKLECTFEAGDFAAIVSATEGAKSAEAYYWRTRSYSRLALAAYTRLGELPASAETYELKAKIETERRQFAESANDWRAALQLSPDNLYVQEQLAIALYKTGSLPEARSLFRALLKGEPDAADLNFYLGDTLLNSQKPQDAIRYLERALRGDPRLLPAERSLGLAYMQTGQTALAIPHLQRALPIDQDGSLHYQLGRAYLASGERERASAMIKQYQQMHGAEQAANQQVETNVTLTPPEAGIIQ